MKDIQDYDEPLLIGSSETKNFGINNEDIALLLEKEKTKAGSSYVILEKKGGIKSMFVDLQVDVNQGIDTSAEEIEKRRTTFGSNHFELPELKSISINIISTFKSRTMIFLIIFATLRIVMDLYKDSFRLFDGASIYFLVVLISLISGFAKSVKDNIFLNLHIKLNEKQVRVLRQSQELMISQEDLLVGDILIVTAGDIIKTDCIVVKAFSVEILNYNNEKELYNFVNLSEDYCLGLQKSYVGKTASMIKTQFPFVFSGSRITKGFAYMLVLTVGKNSSKLEVINEVNLMAKKVSEKSAVMSRTDERILPSTATGGQEGSPTEREQLSSRTQLGKHDLSNFWNDQGFILDFIIKTRRFVTKIGIIVSVLVFFELIFRFLISNNHKLTLPFVVVDDVLNVLILVIISIPESISMLFFLTLAKCIKSMGELGIFVKNLEALEEMACCDMLCIDYNCIFSKNDKEWIKSIILEDVEISTNNMDSIKDHISQDMYSFFIESICINSTAFKAEINGINQYFGSSTERALIHLTTYFKENYSDYRNNYNRPIIDRSPENPDSSFWYTIIEMSEKNDKVRVYITGSYEALIGNIDYYIEQKKEVIKPNRQILTANLVKCTESHKDLIRKYSDPRIKSLSKVLLFCYKDIGRDEYYSLKNDIKKYSSYLDSNISCGLTYLGMAELCDESNLGTQNYLKTCNNAGIQIKVFSNKDYHTSVQNAIKSGFINESEEVDQVVNARQQITEKIYEDQINSVLAQNYNSCEAEVINSIANSKVLYNACSRDKITIVKYFDKIGYNVAVIGNYINDYHEIDDICTSIAIGSSTTDITKETADFIINTNNADNFIHILINSRHLFDNVIRFFGFYITFFISTLMIIIITTLPMFSYAFYPSKLLWLNLLTNTLGPVSFALSEPHAKLLEKVPFKKDNSFIDFSTKIRIAVQVIVQFTILLSLFIFRIPLLSLLDYLEDAHYYADSTENVSELTFLKEIFKTCVVHILIIMQVFNAVLFRLWGSGLSFIESITANSLFYILQLVIVILEILVIQFGSFLMDTEPLSLYNHLLCIIIASLLFISEPISRAIIALTSSRDVAPEEKRKGMLFDINREEGDKLCVHKPKRKKTKILPSEFE